MLRWKERIERRLEALEQAQQPSGQVDTSVTAVGTITYAESSSSHRQLPSPGHQASIGSVPLGEADNATLNLDSNLGVFPAASVATGTLRDIASPTLDIISRGVVTLAVAEELFTYFLEHLNRYLHGILSNGDTLAGVRARSSILTTAICTVASFCSASNTYGACYDTFVGQVSSILFATKNSYDDVRALCIAALWLDDIGPTLSGLGKISIFFGSRRANTLVSCAYWLAAGSA